MAVGSTIFAGVVLCQLFVANAGNFNSLLGKAKLQLSLSPVVTKSAQTVLPLVLDSGWQTFWFGNRSEVVSTMFVFQLTSKGYLWVTDAYCKGDSFLIYDNQRLLGQTETVPDDGCKTNTTNPTDAIQDGGYGHVQFNLTKGVHLLGFTVKESPFLAGKAFVRLDSAFSTPGQLPPTSSSSSSSSTYTTNSLTTSTSSPSRYSFGDSWLPYPVVRAGFHVFGAAQSVSMATTICRSMGLKLATIDLANAVDALTLVFDFLGPNREAWIAKFSVSRKGRNFILLTGSSRGKGSIKKMNNVSKPLPFICQEPSRPYLATPAAPF